MSKKGKKQAFLRRRAKKLEKKRHKQKLHKHPVIISHDMSDRVSRPPGVVDMMELMDQSHLLWNEPEFSDFPFPIDQWNAYLQSAIEQIQAEETGQRIRENGENGEDEERASKNRTMLFTHLFTDAVRNEITVRIDRAVKRLTADPSLKSIAFLGVKAVMEAPPAEREMPLSDLPFFSELIERTIPEEFHTAMQRESEWRDMVQQVLQRSPDTIRSPEEFDEAFADPKVLKRLRTYMRTHPQKRRQIEQDVNKMIHQAIHGVEDGIFDAFLLPKTELFHFFHQFPREFLKEKIKPSDPTPTNQDKKIGAQAMRDFCTYYAQKPLRRLQQRIMRRADQLERAGETDKTRVFRGAQFALDIPLTKNDFFFALLSRSMERQKKERSK